MGKIAKMQNEQNNKNAVNLSYIKKQKPPLKISGIKDIATLIGPGARNHTLNKNQKKFRRNSHITLAALAATALTIYGGVTYQNSYLSNTNSTEYSAENETFNKNDVLNYSVNRLKTIIYKDNLSSIDDTSFEVRYNQKTNSNTFIIYENIRGKDVEKFSYTRYDNTFDKYLNRRNNTDPEISALLSLIIDVYNDPEPSHEDLENLKNVALKLKLNDFALVSTTRNGKIIVNESERDSGYEIGD